MASSTPETGIRFFRSGGHKHDGVTSSLIDFSKFSIFDFGTDVSLNGTDGNRELTRINNQIRFDSYIANFISTQILAPAGIVLLENSVQGLHIGAQEITAINIAANTITANQIAANTITANELAANVVQVGDTISSNNYSANTIGWQIRSNGSAEFNNNVTIKGKIAASTISGSSINIGTGVFTVRVASTTNINIASALIDGSTIDGVVVATGDRVLLRHQTIASERGIYVVVASGAASRSTDADISAEVVNGMFISVSEGTANAGNNYVLITANPITLGTTSLTFTLYTGTQAVTGDVFSVSDDGSFTATSARITGNITAGSSTTITDGNVTTTTITGGTITGTSINVGSGAFTVSNAGALVATSATITGNITAGSASTITGGDIVGGTITIGNTATANLFKVWSDGSLSLGSNTTLSAAPFRVTEQGALVATSATITGNITAGSASSISGSGVTGGTISGTAINIGTGAFTVSNAGALVATSATITGNITAGTASTITGGDIIGGTLTIGTVDPDILRIYSNGALALGNTFGSADFRVDQTGVMRARSGTIGGWTLGSTTITGTNGLTVLNANGQMASAVINNPNFTLNTDGVANMISATIGAMTVGSNSITRGDLTLSNSLLVTNAGVGVMITTGGLGGSYIGLKYGGNVVGSIQGFDDATYGNTISIDTRQFNINNVSRFQLTPTGSSNLNIYFNYGIGSGTGTTVVRTTAGRIVQSSSRRVLKENINPINIASELVKKLNPVTYNWRAHTLSSNIEKYFKALDIQYGFIVEEVEDVDTGLVHYDYNLPHVEGQEMDYTDPKNFSPSMYDANGILSITVSALKEVLERLEILENTQGD